MIDVFMLPGTGFPHGGDGVCEAFANGLDRARFHPVTVSYPAAYGVSGSYPDSRAAGRAALIDAIRNTPNLAVLAGFSQGAAITGDLAAEIGAGKLPDLEVLGAALIADPLRPVGAGLPGMRPVSGYGISGARAIPGVMSWWAAVEGDPITALPAGSPLRSIADLSEYFSISNAVDVVKWGNDLLDRARRGRAQRWWDIANFTGWWGTTTYAWNYLPGGGGKHGPAYVLDGQCAALAQVVNNSITEGAS